MDVNTWLFVVVLLLWWFKKKKNYKQLWNQYSSQENSYFQEPRFPSHFATADWSWPKTELNCNEPISDQMESNCLSSPPVCQLDDYGAYCTAKRLLLVAEMDWIVSRGSETSRWGGRMCLVHWSFRVREPQPQQILSFWQDFSLQQKRCFLSASLTYIFNFLVFFFFFGHEKLK